LPRVIASASGGKHSGIAVSAKAVRIEGTDPRFRGAHPGATITPLTRLLKRHQAESTFISSK